MYEYTQLLVSRADIFLFQVFPEVVALRVLQGMLVSLVFLVVVVVEAVVQELQVVEAEARKAVWVRRWRNAWKILGQQLAKTTPVSLAVHDGVQVTKKVVGRRIADSAAPIAQYRRVDVQHSAIVCEAERCDKGCAVPALEDPI